MKQLLPLLLLLSFNLYSQPVQFLPKQGEYKNLTNYQNKLYFTEQDSLWRSDGTAEGTELVTTGFSNADRLKVIKDRIFFFDNTGLWVSNGTAAGTYWAGEFTEIISPKIFGEQILFWGKDISGETEVYYFTDSKGVRLLKDIFPGDSSSFHHEKASSFKVSENKAFFVANDGIHGNELWVTDGTTEGTKLVEDIYPQKEAEWDTYFHVLDDNVYFFIDSTNSFSLAKSGGVENGIEKLEKFTLDSVVVKRYSSWTVSGEKYHGGIESINGEILFETASIDTNWKYTVNLWKLGANSRKPEKYTSIPYSHEFYGFPHPAFKLWDKVVFHHKVRVTWNELFLTNGLSSGTEIIFKRGSNPAHYINNVFKIGQTLLMNVNVEQGYGGINKINHSGFQRVANVYTINRAIDLIRTTSDKYFFYKEYNKTGPHYDNEENDPWGLHVADVENASSEFLIETHPGYDSLFAEASHLETIEDTVYFTAFNRLYKLILTEPVIASSPTKSSHSKVTAYPNPFSGQVIIKLADQNTTQEIEVRDALGNLVKEVSFPAGQNEVPVDFTNGYLEPGVYFIKAGSGKVIKVVKRR